MKAASAARRRGGRGVGEQLQRVAGLRSSGGRRRRGARSTTARGSASAASARSRSLGHRLARRLLPQRVVALLLDLGGERLQPRVGGEEEVAHLLARRRRAADEAPDDLAEEQLRARGRRVDADAQARDVDALGDHQHRHEPAARARRRSARSAPRRPASSEVTISGALAADPRQPLGEPLRVLLVDRHHEPAGLGVRRRRAGRSAAASASRSTCGDPVALGVERRAQPPGGLGRGQPDARSRRAGGGRRSSTPCRRRRCGR